MEITPKLQKMYDKKDKFLDLCCALPVLGDFLYENAYLPYEDKVKEQEIEDGIDTFRTHFIDVKTWKTQEEIESLRKQSIIVLSYIMCLYKTMSQRLKNVHWDFSIKFDELYRPYIKEPISGFNKEQREELRASGDLLDYYRVDIRYMEWYYNYFKADKHPGLDKYKTVDLLWDCREYVSNIYLKAEDIVEIGKAYGILDFQLFDKDGQRFFKPPFNQQFNKKIVQSKINQKKKRKAIVM